MTRVWSLLTIEEEARQFAGNLGYEDVLGAQYVWDSTVANGRLVAQGDLAVLRNSSVVHGLGWIAELRSEQTTKLRRRCPTCGSTGFKVRKNLTPRFHCARCKLQFDEPNEEQIDVTIYAANYAATWRPLDDPLPVSAIAGAYLSASAQHSIRELRRDVIEDVLTVPATVGPGWWDGQGALHVPGGRRLTIGPVRIGQQRFRKLLIGRFGEQCAIKGPQHPATLEAAHLYRYCDTEKHDLAGGLLLRRDLHTLFDRWLLAIDPADWTVRTAPALRSYPELTELDGSPLRINPAHRPKADYLAAHLAFCRDAWNR